MNWKDGVFALVRDREMTGEMYRVLLVLLAQGDGTAAVYLSQREIGEICNMRQQNVGRSLSKLAEKGIVRKEYREDRICYLVAEYFGMER
jgi:DNA-binding MarR family transcriptional regulator